MTIKSTLALHRARRLVNAGRTATAVESLKNSCARMTDPRLFIQKAILSGEIEDRSALRRLYPQNAAALLTASVLSYAAGEYEDADRSAMDGLSASPADSSLKTLILLARSRAGHEPLDIPDLRKCAENAVLIVKSHALLELERRIIESHPGDRGAAEKEDTLGGPFGFILDRLDDLAAVMGYLLSHSLNLLMHLGDSKKRAVYRLIADGDRLWAMRRHDEAVTRFEETLRMDPACVEALESLTRHYMEEGDMAKAVERFSTLEKALASAGGAMPPHRVRIAADLAFFTGKHEKACGLYAETIKTSPHDHMPPYRRGLCLLRMGAESAAVESFKLALSIPNPKLMEDRFDTLEAVYKG